jgi:hypothetical protein
LQGYQIAPDRVAPWLKSWIPAALAEGAKQQRMTMQAQNAWIRQIRIRQQTVCELPDVSRVPVAKHPLLGRYFWALFTTVAGRDLITSLDLPRAKSSFALTPKLVAASTTAMTPKDANIDFALIVKSPFSFAPAGYLPGREIEIPNYFSVNRCARVIGLLRS